MRERCGNCASWRIQRRGIGECWSGDRLDGDFSNGSAGTTHAHHGCEAHTPEDEHPTFNVFRCANDGSLDRQYLRISAVSRLIRCERITTKARAIELLEARGVKNAGGIVELWLAHQFKHLLIAHVSGQDAPLFAEGVT